MRRPVDRATPSLGVLVMALALVAAAFLGAALGLIWQDRQGDGAAGEQASEGQGGDGRGDDRAARQQGQAPA